MGRCCHCDFIVFQGKVGPPGPTGLKGEKVRPGLGVRDTRASWQRDRGEALGRELGQYRQEIKLYVHGEIDSSVFCRLESENLFL